MEIDNLIETSSSIKSTFSQGVQTISGQLVYAPEGGITPTGMAQAAHLTVEQTQAYNAALSSVSVMNTEVTAQEYFDNQVDNSFQALDTAISTYVEASTQLVSAVKVNEMASSVETTADLTEVKTYISNNDLTITDTQVETYNNALDMVEVAAQSAAAFTAIASDVDLVESAQAQADALGQSFSFAETSYYSQGNLSVTLSGGDVSLDVSGYIKTALDVLAAGQDGTFYTTSPVGDCFFNQEGC